MPAKLTKEEFVQKANNVHWNKYDYSNFVLINMTTKAEIICKVHGSFWQIPRDHINSKSGCRKCSAEKASKRETMSFDEFLEKARKAHGDKYSYYQETYVEARKKIKINCKLHGDFWQQGTNHYKGSDCYECGIIKLKTTSKIKYDYVEKAKQIYGDLCDYSCTVYVSSKSKIKYSCNKHGLIKQLPSDHIRSGCPKCGMERTAIKRTISFEKFVELAEQKHGNKYLYYKDNYKNLKTDIKANCPDHGIFIITPGEFLKNKTACRKCDASKKLENLNIEKKKREIEKVEAKIIQKHNKLSIKKQKYKKNLSFEMFVERAILIHGDKYEYDKTNFVNAKTKTKINCKIHGIFSTTPTIHILKNRPQGCKACGIERRKNIRKLSIENVITRANDVHKCKYDYSKIAYVNNSSKIEIICKEHGSFWQTFKDHVQLEAGCPKCAQILQGDAHRMKFNEFVKKSKECHGDKYIYYEEYFKDAMSKTTINCPKHGKFSMAPNSHYFGQGCKKCTWQVSKMETRWLDYIGIPMENRNCKLPGLGRYEVDGYMIDDKGTIWAAEFNGSFWHGDLRIFKKDDYNNVTKCTFGDLYTKTLRKEALILAQGYMLITIWEKDFLDMEKKFKEFQTP